MLGMGFMLQLFHLMIDQGQITDKLIFSEEVYGYGERKIQEEVGGRKLSWSCESGAIGLQITYPIKLKYGFINQVLRHLVATINKSALISFLVKVDFSSNSPLLLTFYHTMLLPLASSHDYQEKTPEIAQLFALPDLIYRKIMLICEGYTIRHSQLAKAYELIQQISHFSQQISRFIEEIQLISQKVHTSNHFNFADNKTSLCSQSYSF